MIFLTISRYIFFFHSVFQEAQNPPRQDRGHQLGKDDGRGRNIMQLLSRCSMLWFNTAKNERWERVFYTDLCKGRVVDENGRKEEYAFSPKFTNMWGLAISQFLRRVEEGWTVLFLPQVSKENHDFKSESKLSLFSLPIEIPIIFIQEKKKIYTMLSYQTPTLTKVFLASLLEQTGLER